MREHLQAIVTVLSLINPVVCGAMFARVEAGRPRGQQVTDATSAVSAILAILVLAALVGTRLLDLFNVSLDAFMVAGGGVLAWIGFSMLSGKRSSQSQDTRAASSKESLTPS
jgi:multiple antibiotic resistance protein